MSVRKTNRLVLHGKLIALYYKNHTELIDLCTVGVNAGFIRIEVGWGYKDLLSLCSTR